MVVDHFHYRNFFLDLSTHVSCLDFILVQYFNCYGLVGFGIDRIFNPNTILKFGKRIRNKYNITKVDEKQTHFPKAPSPRVPYKSYFPTVFTIL